MPESETLEELMAAAQRGDRAAYRALLTQAAAMLHAFVRQRGAGSADAEDLVQDVLMAVHRKLATCDTSRGVAPWLYGIARYKLADHWRRRAREPRCTVLDEETVEARAFDDSAIDVATMLASLPPAQAEALRLTRIEGRTSREAAREAGIGTSVMKLRVHRGLARLRSLFAGSGG